MCNVVGVTSLQAVVLHVPYSFHIHDHQLAILSGIEQYFILFSYKFIYS